MFNVVSKGVGALAVTIGLVVLTGCAKPVAVQPGPSATATECAQVLVNLPDQVDTLSRRETTSQATAAFTDEQGKLTIRLVCGVEPPPPTTAACTTVAGVDWISREVGTTETIYTTFGRSPAVQISVPRAVHDGVDLLLASVSASVQPIEPTRHCV